MQLVGLASALLTIVLGTAVGARLFALSRRTGEAPERLVGLGMLAFAALAYPLFLALVFAGGALPRPLLLLLTAGAHVGYFLCLLLLGLFTRRVFRPEAPWATAAVATLALLEATGAAASFGALLLDPAEAATSVASDAGRWGSTIIPLAFGGLFAWTSAEALRYRALLGRRLALGLADPVVVNRFAVWGVGMGAAALVDVALAGCSVAGVGPSEHALPALLQSASGLFNAVAWWLTFSPPEGYRAWVRRWAAASAPSAGSRPG